MSWKDDINLGPWSFTEQEQKLGYPGHDPCGYWFKDYVEITPNPILAKAIIIDIATRWGGADSFMGFRQMSCYLNGVFVSIAALTYNAYATTFYDASRAPLYALDVSQQANGPAATTGFDGWDCWLSKVGSPPNRFIQRVSEGITLDRLDITNYHASGDSVIYGVKDVKIYYSTDVYINTTYEADIATFTLIYDGEIPQHVATDTEDQFTINF